MTKRGIYYNLVVSQQTGVLDKKDAKTKSRSKSADKMEEIDLGKAKSEDDSGKNKVI
jgi:hypothetical protein